MWTQAVYIEKLSKLMDDISNSPAPSRPWSRLRKLSGWLAQIAFLAAGLSAVYFFQTRNLLETDGTMAPPLALTTLDGGAVDLHGSTGTPTLVYFFAPWCHVCAASAHNVRATRRSQGEDELSILLVALDWSDEAEVRRYAEDHDLQAPVLLGDYRTARDWQVFGFPTYYVVDSQNRIAHKDFGYSSRFGLWWRTRFTD